MGGCSADGTGVENGEDDTPVEVAVDRAVALGTDRAVEITAKIAAPSARIISTLTTP
jgi:hypothetical protein